MAAIKTESAGGEEADEESASPSEAQAVSQVGGSQAGKKQVKLPEFTAEASKSDKWALRGGWLFIGIKVKYLNRGDVGECGWVCLKEAPLEFAFYVAHPNPTSVNLPNAD